MAELYTSLSRAKQILMATRDWRGEGAPPPPVAMTPVPEKVRHIINPEYTIGLGALRECGTIEEDGKKFPCPECRGETCEERGLQCPACGEWGHTLKKHIRAAHSDIGGVDAIKQALSIPYGASLTSRRTRAVFRQRAAERVASGVTRGGDMELVRNATHRSVVRARRSHSRASVGLKNLRNTCEKQVLQRIVAVESKIGRSPTYAEAQLADPGLAQAAVTIFGTWNNAVAQAGLRPTRIRGWDKTMVLEALRTWYDAHARLPTVSDVERPSSTPLLPHRRTMMDALEVDSWPEAMRKAAAMLGIRGGRYGLPERQKAA